MPTLVYNVNCPFLCVGCRDALRKDIYRPTFGQKQTDGHYLAEIKTCIG